MFSQTIRPMSFVITAALSRLAGWNTDILLRAPKTRGRLVHSRGDGTYINPNRKLPRKAMLAARRIEQLSRRGA